MISRFDSSVFPGVASQVQGLEAYAEARWQDLRLEGELNHHLACIPSSDNKCFERFWIGSKDIWWVLLVNDCQILVAVYSISE